MKKSIANFENNILTRDEMKKMSGGHGCLSGSCTLVVMGSNGQSMSLSGHCNTVFGAYNCYCETGIGPTNLKSNGGISRCTA